MKSIRTSYTLLLAVFFTLVAVSVGVTFWGLHWQSDDALLVNLAARQRVLVQQMARHAVEMDLGIDERASLQSSMDIFGQTLESLQAGGQVLDYSGVPVVVRSIQDDKIQRQLDRVGVVWRPFQSDLEAILSNPQGSPAFQTALDSLQRRSPELIQEVDNMVGLYQALSSRRVQRLLWVQVGFFAGALLLLGVGSLLTRRFILKPLNLLGRSARRIGRGDLSTPVEVTGPQEIELLASKFELMRSRLEVDQKELREWAETLEDRVEQRTRELDAFYEVSREISSRLDLEQVLQSVTDKARELLDAEVALLCMVDGEQVMSLQALSGREASLRNTSSTENPFVQGILQGPHARLCPAQHCSEACGILAGSYRKSHMAAALWAGERAIGALCVGSRQEHVFNEGSAALLTKLSYAAGVAIENARLYRQAERVAALEERQRIAAEMHDGLGQMINYLGLIVDQAGEQIEKNQAGQAARTLARVRQGIDRASAEVRRSIANLQEGPHPSGGLRRKLASLIEELCREDNGQITWLTDLDDSMDLSDEETQQALRIAREALLNARRHSGATEVRLQLVYRDGHAELSVKDNGCGFDPSTSPSDGRQHFGLSIMQARAAWLNGSLDIQSFPGEGTCIHLVWPVKKARKEAA